MGFSDHRISRICPGPFGTLKRLAELETLSDTEMVRQQRAAMTDPGAPNPSVEAILHALIPFRYVDHTHADAVLAVTNHPDGEKSVQEIYGNRVIVIPYVMPGFVLAKKVRELTQGKNWADYEGMILMNHGIFTFDDDARESYEKMIRLVTEAEDYVRQKGARETSKAKSGKIWSGWPESEKVSETAGKAMLAVPDQTEDAGGSAAGRIFRNCGAGPLTPDHVLRTKNIPVMLDENPAEAIETFKNQYLDYFKRNTDGQLTCLDPAPRWAVWKEHGTLPSAEASRKPPSFRTSSGIPARRSSRWKTGAVGRHFLRRTCSRWNTGNSSRPNWENPGSLQTSRERSPWFPAQPAASAGPAQKPCISRVPRCWDWI